MGGDVIIALLLVLNVDVAHVTSSEFALACVWMLGKVNRFQRPGREREPVRKQPARSGAGSPRTASCSRSKLRSCSRATGTKGGTQGREHGADQASKARLSSPRDGMCLRTELLEN